VGVYFGLAFFFMFKYIKRYYNEIILLFLGPIVLLTMPWGKIFGNFSILFAQPIIPLYFAFAVVLFLKNKKCSFMLLLTQVVISLYAIWFGMYELDLQIIKTNIPNMLFFFALLLQILFVITGITLLLKKDAINEVS
jgi:hypothetical protein